MRIVKGVFLRRLNRFVIECLIEGKIQRAYLPNPGRLLEILLPDTPIYLEPAKRGSSCPFTVYGAKRGNRVVMLHTHYTNRVARWLINRGLVPGLEKYRIKKEEVKWGNSRFDFLLDDGRQELLLEVKSCTLFHRGIALFPDAPTERGKRHLVELAASGKGAVLFVIQDPEIKLFVPDYHTDPDFSKTLYELRKGLTLRAVCLGWDENMEIKEPVKTVDIGIEHIKAGLSDSGIYAVVLRLNEDRTIEVGSLGRINFRAGHYVYVGSAKTGLTSRIQRHKRLRKGLHWHIDYLRKESEWVHSFPIRGALSTECQLARSIGLVATAEIKGFGSSDCGCNSHLFFMEENPLQSRPFIETILDFRTEGLRKLPSLTKNSVKL
ncbi:MAG: DNA/RNA nuclease SfsA [Nitrospirae bacterium]|nr:MAG: DNA/RNA nuclease SfsA [Nitrospirota bacterium]